MGEMADYLTEQGMDQLAMHDAGMCDGPCQECEAETPKAPKTIWRIEWWYESMGPKSGTVLWFEDESKAWSMRDQLEEDQRGIDFILTEYKAR